jgi:hypothetical protein
VLIALACVTLACAGKTAPAHERTLFFRGEPAAHIEERLEADGTGKHITRHMRLASGDIVDTSARIDAYGFVIEAHYRRGAKRAVDLNLGALTDGSGAQLALALPVVAVDLLRHVSPRVPTKVTIVDLASGDAMTGLVERRSASVTLLDEEGGLVARCNVEGSCTGPGAFFEGTALDEGGAPSLDTVPVEVALVATGPRRSLRLAGIDDVLNRLELDGPGQRASGPGVVAFDSAASRARAPAREERAPGLFIESADAAVVAFAAKHTESTAEPLADAVSLVAAVSALVNPAAVDAPPSAQEMLAHGGDCDGAAALLTAALRARGHAARAVVGYRLAEGRFVPHAWAEVHTENGWLLVDAAVPRVGSDDEHLRLFTGLGSALTMGRVLGRLRVEPVP